MPLDDAWIHFVYADRALHTGLLHYNPGEPAAGTSSLLWILLLAGPQRLGVYPPVAAKLLGLLTQLVLAGLLYLALRKFSARPPALVGALLVCADPLSTLASLSGMETMLYTCLACGALVALLYERPAAAGVLAGLTVISRPDGALLAAAVLLGGLLHFLITERGRPRFNARLGNWIFWLIAPSLLLGLFWGFLNWRATGRFLPASFYIRAGAGEVLGGRAGLTGALRGLAGAGAFIGQPWHWVLYALGLIRMIRRRDWRLLPLAAFPWLLLWLFGGDRLLIIGGALLPRYIVPAWPFLLLTQGMGALLILDLLRLDRFSPEAARRKWLPAAVALLWLLATIGDPRVPYRRWRDDRAAHQAACGDIENMQVNIGEWLAAHTPATAVVGAYDAGAIAYFSERRVVDILGLNSPGVKPLDPKTIAGLDYLVIYPDEHLSHGVEKPYADRLVYERLLENSSIVAGPRMAVYRVNSALSEF